MTDNHGMTVLSSHAAIPAARTGHALTSYLEPPRRRTLVAILAVCLIAVAGYVVTAGGRGFCSDDFALRKWFVEQGWLGAYGQYCKTLGINRPLGVLNILAWYGWLWPWPIAHQLLLTGLHTAVCVLLFTFVRTLTADFVAAATAAALFAAWHTSTCVVLWTSAGGGLLPAAAGLLAALILYSKSISIAPSFRARSASDGSNANQSSFPHRPNTLDSRYRRLSVIAFFVSVLFHDQHLGAAALFSTIALLTHVGDMQHAPLRTRLRRVAQTWPYWFVAIAVGLVSLFSSVNTRRPLRPDVEHLSSGVASVLRGFWAQSVVTPFEQMRLRSGAIASLSRWAQDDPAQLAIAITGVLAGCALLWSVLRPPSERPPKRGRLQILTAGGAILTAATLGIMAVRPDADLGPRHTFFPAMGVALMIAAAVGTLSRARFTFVRRGTPVALIGLILTLSFFRLGQVYEWSTRTQIADRVLASLTAIYPEPAEDELLVIDGVRKYGRGFMNSWGLSSAFSLDRGVNVRITTVLRRTADGIVANEPWDVYSWPVDQTNARFFTWCESEQRLVVSSWRQFLAAHPQLTEGQSS